MTVDGASWERGAKPADDPELLRLRLLAFFVLVTADSAPKLNGGGGCLIDGDGGLYVWARKAYEFGG